MKVYQRAEVFVERDDGKLEFYHTKLILLASSHNFFYTVTKERASESSSLDLDKLTKMPILAHEIWPPFPSTFTRAPDILPPNTYVKEPNLIRYGDSTTLSGMISGQILHQVSVCEMLKRRPHPNIARYLGCIVEDGRIKGICFEKYDLDLDERMKSAVPLDKHLCLRAIEGGIRHMHSLGLIHNDINPHNIMFNEPDQPIIVDFQTCRDTGQALSPKADTYGWSMEGVSHAVPENDFARLTRIRDYLYAPRDVSEGQGR